jgi:hypothetical protein
VGVRRDGPPDRARLGQRDAHVFTLSDGRVTRWRNFSDRSEAFKAAGLQE